MPQRVIELIELTPLPARDWDQHGRCCQRSKLGPNRRRCQRGIGIKLTPLPAGGYTVGCVYQVHNEHMCVVVCMHANVAPFSPVPSLLPLPLPPPCACPLSNHGCAFPHPQVQSWLRGVVVRKTALSRWDRMLGPQMYEDELNLADLFQPNVFLNVLRQETARKLQCSMDSLKLATSFDRGHGDGPGLSVCLRGLLLQGAGFDGKQLVASTAEALELMGVPSITLSWVEKRKGEGGESDNLARVPLYYSLSRERLLVEMTVPSGGRDAKWTVAGVAMFLCDEE